MNNYEATEIAYKNGYEAGKPKWIPVSERLPQEDEPEATICEQVQVLLSNGFVTTGWCNRYYKVWWHLNHGETHFVGFNYEDTPVIAWQPLAEPPKGE